MLFVYSFFLPKIPRKEVFGDVLDGKLNFRDYENIDLIKSQNLHFSMVLVKIVNFFIFYVKLKNVSDVLDIKLTFLDYKKLDLTKSLNLHFPKDVSQNKQTKSVSKGVSPWFLSNIVIFLFLFFLG